MDDHARVVVLFNQVPYSKEAVMGVEGIKRYLGQLFGLDEVRVTPDDERRKAVITFAVIGAAFLLGFAFYEAGMGITRLKYQAGAQFWEALLLILPVLGLALWTNRIALAETTLVVSGFVVFLSLTFFGGIAEDAIFWTFVYPYLVFFLKGQRAGWVIGVAYALCAPVVMELGTRYWGLWYRAELNLYYSLSYLFNVLVAAAFNLLRSTFQARLWEAVEFNTREVRRHLLMQQYNATHDLATDLLNREGLVPEIGMLGNKPQVPVWVVVINFHRARELSSIAGMAVVDELVLRLAGHLRWEDWKDVKVGRLRQNVLCLVLETREEAPSIADRIRTLLEQSAAGDGGGFSLHGEYSMGMAFQQPGNAAINGGKLLQKAEQAQLHARHENVPFALYDDTVEAGIVQYHILYEKVRLAIDQGELVLHYQPQIDLRTNRVVGAEALARWFDAVDGSIPPAKFIPIIESSGLLARFSLWTVREAIRACSAWQQHIPGKTVSINLSAGALHQHGMVTAIQDALTQHQLDPALVVIELTESVMLKSPEEAMAAMNELVRLGVSLSIDDYGSGFSSLTYIKQLPSDELKIDKSFVTDCLQSHQDKAIIGSTVELGHLFGLKVLAEGVEDMETALVLTAMGSDRAQGWYYSRALPEEKYVQWVLEYDRSRGEGAQ